MEKTKILVVDLEYHMQNANTLIVDRICRQIGDIFDVTICAIDPDCFITNHKLSGGLSLVDFPVHSFRSRIINKPFDYCVLFILLLNYLYLYILI